jgi:hypothetical protein
MYEYLGSKHTQGLKKRNEKGRREMGLVEKRKESKTSRHRG